MIVEAGCRETIPKLPQSAIKGNAVRNGAYPNPFNPSTILEYSLPKEGFVSLKVYNSIGEEVAVLVDQLRTAGTRSVRFDGERLAGGVYILRLQAGGVIQTNKMILLK
jgi:hypothetical protein